jgi:hypothetical protein
MRRDEWRDLAERFTWTVIQVATANVTAAVVFDVSWWKMAAASGLAAGCQVVSWYARRRLRGTD